MQEDREKAIEQIVENSTSEKYQRLADVKQKYFPDITRLQEKLTKEPSCKWKYKLYKIINI